MKNLSVLSLVLLCLLAAACRPQAPNTPSPANTAPPGVQPTLTPRPSPTPEPINHLTGQDLWLLSISEGGYAHLFIFDPASQSLTRLTNGPWHDVSPALSPDGRTLAFASDRNNYWDLYLLDLPSGEVRPLTDTPNYENAPAWSPDGQWLVYEAYADDNLDLFIVHVSDLTQPPIRLTTHPATDFSPAWSPDGRRIAFVSTRGGQSDIWLANLDISGEERFINLSHTPGRQEDHPVWRPDGQGLAWGSLDFATGLHQVFWQDMASDRAAARMTGSGDAVAWSPEGGRMAVLMTYPNQTYLSAWTLGGQLLLPPTQLPGQVRGFLWMPPADWMTNLPETYHAAAQVTPTPLWALGLTPAAEGPQRWRIVALSDVDAPYPGLHDLVDEAYQALRTRTAAETGWDALANLENAFVPLSQHLDPGLQQDWLYTGRAFALNRLLSQAGWMTVSREDYNQRTWWRLYLRPRAQDGSQGEPLHHLVWDFEARYTLDPGAYDQGGQFIPPPSGYWVDFTALAADFGWQRVPALANWQSYYAGTRFTEFVKTEGQTWEEAMREIYPEIIFSTPTAVIPPTWTPTVTPRVWRTNTPTTTPSMQPTFTPQP